MCFFEDFMTVEQQLADEDVVSAGSDRKLAPARDLHSKTNSRKIFPD
jgi:hypothetical protein